MHGSRVAGDGGWAKRFFPGTFSLSFCPPRGNTPNAAMNPAQRKLITVFISGGVLSAVGCHERKALESPSRQHSEPHVPHGSTDASRAAAPIVRATQPEIADAPVDTSPQAIAVVMSERWGNGYEAVSARFGQILKAVGPVGRSRGEIVRMFGEPDSKGKDNMEYRFENGFHGRAWRLVIKDDVVSSYFSYGFN